jgi:Zn-dependent protease
MKWSWTIGAFFKIPVRLHVSMLILPLLTYNWLHVDGVMGIFTWLALVVLLFGSVLLHEIGHALTARRFGIHTKDIILTPIGGMARIVAMPNNPKQEIAIAIAGPIVSLAIAAVGFIASIAVLAVPIIPTTVITGLGILMYINLMLGLFNLVPALPMDGGRVLRGFLALKYDFLKATIIAARVGRTLAIVGGLTAVFWLDNSWTLLLISIFIYMSAGTEIRMAQMREYQKKVSEGVFNRPGPNPFGNTRGPYWHGASGSKSSSQGPDWSQPTRTHKKDVVVIQGGKSEVISRKDPNESDE